MKNKDILDFLEEGFLLSRINTYGVDTSTLPKTPLLLGVGGGGCNIIFEYALKSANTSLDFCFADTALSPLTYRKDALDSNPTRHPPLSARYVQLGATALEGRGAANIERGALAVEESVSQLVSISKDFNLSIIVAGLGHGTGTAFMEPLHQLLQAQKSPHVFIVSTPIEFEGEKKKLLALNAIKSLRESGAAILVVCNDDCKRLCLEMGNIFSLSNVFEYSNIMFLRKIETVLDFYLKEK